MISFPLGKLCSLEYTQRDSSEIMCNGAGWPLPAERMSAGRIRVSHDAQCSSSHRPVIAAVSMCLIRGSAWSGQWVRLAMDDRTRCGTAIEGIYMNWDRVQGHWKQFAGKTREQWGKLTHDPFDVVAGRHEQLAGRLQERLGLSKELAQRHLSIWKSNVGDTWRSKDRKQT